MKRTKSKEVTAKKEYTMAPKWDITRIRQGYGLALLGLTDAEIAAEMEVSLPTLNYWKKNREGFYEALKQGKLAADTKVVNALYNNALGFEYDDMVVLNNKVKEFNEFGRLEREYFKVEVVTVKKKVLPDTKAQIKWLQARQPDKWGDMRSIKVKNQLNISIQTNNIDFSEISDSELALIKKLGLLTDTPAIEEGYAEEVD